MDVNRSANVSSEEGYPFANQFPLDYRVTATVVHALIFVAGVTGNVVLIVVARRNKSLHTPTFAYLVSLACADLIVLISAVPEAIVVHHLGARWLLGQMGCSLFVFLNFLGINAGSLSILAFTTEQYVAVCCARRRRTLRTVCATRKHVTGIWVFSLLYCLPWLALTEVRPDLDDPDIELCELRLSKEVHGAVFAVDLLLFYVFPLMFAVYAYARVGCVLVRSTRLHRFDQSMSAYGLHARSPVKLGLQRCSASSMPPVGHVLVNRTLDSQRKCVAQSRAQVVQMLVAIVVCFAIAWLPFRGLLVYNSFVEEPWINLWFMFVAKTLIFVNSAMNPFLYNAMSPRFRTAVYRLLFQKGNDNLKSSSHICRPRRAHCQGLLLCTVK